MSFLDVMFDSHFPSIEKKPWMEDVNFFLVQDEDTMQRCVEESIASGLYGLDTETTGLDTRVFDGVTNSKIVGVCIAPTENRGYYIPLRHKKGKNLSVSIFLKQFKRLMESDSIACFHNAKFDQEVLEFAGSSEPWGTWENINKWDDTLILAYLDDPLRKKKGLKYLSKTYLKRDMIELEDLFPKGQKDRDFSSLDADWPPVLWYAAGDAINTRSLRGYFYPRVCNPEDKERNQKDVYSIEKGCLLSTRWMERNRIPIDVAKVRDLICMGQEEFLAAFFDVYETLKTSLKRDVTPSFLKKFRETANTKDPSNPIFEQIENLSKKKSSFFDSETITNEEGEEYPRYYDILSAQQLGKLFQELKVPNLKVTEKSGQVKTSKDELDLIVEKHGNTYGFMKKIKKFRELQKALSTYLYPLFEDHDETDQTLWVNFNAYKVDTGRFCTPQDKARLGFGGTRYNLQSTPAKRGGDRPKCMEGLRDCFVAPDNYLFAAIDFSGVELRIVTNLSKEPRWVDAFYQCSSCGTTFTKEKPAPQFCTSCGSDKVGDIHSLTAFDFFGKDCAKRPDFKDLRGKSKGANFALCYGGSYKALMRSIKCDEKTAKIFKQKFDVGFPTLAKWWAKTIAYARRKGFVRTAFGRVYPVPDIHHEDGGFRSKAERNSINTPVQGTSADITKATMYAIYKECRDRGWLDKVKMIITMHDELCFLIQENVFREAVDMLREQMTGNQYIKWLYNRKNDSWEIPLTIDIEVGKTWSVPWNLTNLMHEDKGKPEKWPPVLQRIYPDFVIPEEKVEAPKQEIPKILIKEPLDERSVAILNYCYKKHYSQEGVIANLCVGSEILRQVSVCDVNLFESMVRELGL